MPVTGTARNSSKPSSSTLHNGTPPWHAAILLASFIAFFCQRLPPVNSIHRNDDNKSTLESIFSQSLFPTILPLNAIIYIRLIFATVIFADIVRASCFVVYLDHRTEYYPGSKLRKGAPIEYRGILTKHGTLWSGSLGIASFTMVCWLLEGTMFFMAALIPIMAQHGYPVAPILVGITLTIWEIVSPSAFLVTLVVTYVLWPSALEAKRRGKEGNLGLLNRLGPLLAHNLNVVAIVTEMTILGGLPLHWNHYAWAPLYGSIYVLFSWAMHDQWLPQLSKKERQSWGPQYVYPFMDVSLGWMHTFSLFLLLMVLLGSHMLVVGLQVGLDWLSSQMFEPISSNDRAIHDTWKFALHVTTIIVVGLLVCRVR